MSGRRGMVLGLVGLGAGLGAGYLLGRREVPPPPAGQPAAGPEPLPDVVELSPEAERNFGIAAEPAAARPLRRRVRATGMIGYNERRVARITPLSRGRVQAVEVSVGDRVTAGQRLLILDALDLAEARHSLATAEAGQRQAEAEAATALAALQRAQDLVRGGALAQSELERRRAELVRTQAAAASRAVEASHWQEMLSRYSPATRGVIGERLPGDSPADALGAVLAPFAGTVMALGAAPGEMAESGREILTLADLSLLWAQAEVPERELGGITAGIAMELSVPAFPGRSFAGTVVHVADEIDTRTGTARVRCDLPNPQGLLRVNMFANIALLVPLDREGLVVPEGAVQSVDGRPTIFVALGSQRYARREVTLGVPQPDGAEVTSGLTAGEPVVVSGSFRLKSLLLQSRMAGED
jgi:cobalt-zinc-cadmium efflux system membrane fusion protein